MNNINRPMKSFMVLPGMKPVYTSDPKRPGETRMPGCKWLPNRVRHLIVSMLGEFVGTYLFLFFAFAGCQVANNSSAKAGSGPNVATILYISLAFGFSLLVNVWMFFRISGGLFNPAVSVAMALVGAIDWLKASLLILSQVAAGIAAAGVVSALFPGPLAVRTSLSQDTSVVRGLFIEMFLTAELIFCIFMLAAEKHKATFLAPVGIGLALFIAQMAGIYYTGASLNPARSFGPDVILSAFDGYHWIYWLGPLLGAFLAVIFYRLIKLLEYETANPGADSDGRDLYPRSQGVEPHPDARHAGRQTDGAADHDFMLPIHPLHHSLPPRQTVSHNQTTPHQETASSHATASCHDTTSIHDTPSAESSNLSLPIQPVPVYQQQTLDGPYSRISLDHPNERPRAQHRRSSLSSHSQYSPEQETARGYHGGPSAETGSAGYSGSSSSDS